MCAGALLVRGSGGNWGLGNYWDRIGIRRGGWPIAFASIGLRRGRRPTMLALDAGAAVLRPPLLVCARWENGKADLCQPSDRLRRIVLSTALGKGEVCLAADSL